MTIDTQNPRAIRGILENTLNQVLSTQTQVTAIERQLREIQSQIDLSLEAVDPVLKQLETLGTGRHQAEKVRSDMAATLSGMLEQVSHIVNDARDQMLNFRENRSDTPDANPHAVDAVTEAVLKVTREAVAEIEPDEPTPGESLSSESPTGELPSEESLTAELPTGELRSAESLSSELPTGELPSEESLTGSQVGQRATESLNEMIAAVAETNTETDPSQEQEEKSQWEPEMEATEVQALASQERETQRTPIPETPATEPAPPASEVNSPEKEAPKGPGSRDSLSELLAKAKAASPETDSAATDLTPLDDEEDEEDAQTVSELLKTTSGSFVTQ